MEGQEKTKLEDIENFIKKIEANRRDIEKLNNQKYKEINPKGSHILDQKVMESDIILERLESERKRILGIRDFSNEYDGTSYNTNLIDQQIESAETISLTANQLETLLYNSNQTVENTSQTLKNTSHSKRNLFVTGIISFLAGLFSSLIVLYVSNPSIFG